MLMLRAYGNLRYIKNRSIRALLISDALMMTAAAMLAPIYALFVDKVGGDIMAAGITAAALAFGSGVACLLAGRGIDRMQNKRNLLVASGVVMAGGFVAYGLAGSVWQLAAIQVVMGVVQAIHATAYDALYTRHLDKEHEGEEWGAWEALYYFATAGGALAGGYLVVQSGFETLFLVMALLTIVSALYLLRLPRRLL